MSPRKSSWEHFGGRKDGQQGVKTLEADLCLWAHNKFTPVQAQAKLCHNNMYAATYRSTMEVRKEFMPGIVQNYNKSKQFTASGEPSKVSIFKGKLNPMHLSVQKGYLKDKGLVFDDHAWAVEHFLLNDPKVQQQLFKYLELLPAKDLEKEGMPSNADQDQQQSWILEKAAADYTSFVASTAQLALSICPDITVDHLQPEAADVIVEQYAKQLGHSLQQWTDSTVALANIKQVLDGLGLASVAWQSQEAAIAHAVAVNENSEPHADAAALDTDSIANLGSELLQELETPLQSPFLAESGDPLVTLRAAAIVKEHWIYMFNLDESPATCDILSPFACSYKAKVSAEGGSQKTLSVKHVAWSRKLGKDFLPKSLLNNRFYARSKIAVILKQDDNYFSCTPQLSRSGPMASLLPAVQEQLGLSFVPMEFLPDERPSSAQQQQASKRKKGGKRKASASEARPSKTRKKAHDTALLSATLNLLLGENPQMNAWQKWAKGAATATPPCQIRLRDVDWALIGGLTGSHYPAIKALYDRKAFTDEAWQNIEPTMQKLSADFREEPTDSAAAATVDEDCTDADDDAEDDQDVEDADSEVYGLGQRRELPSGWRSVGGAAKMIKAAEVQIRQGASMQQLDEFLQELCECYEVDKSLCEAINPHWDESVHAMVKDMASMPPKTWAKYWSRMMGWEDWMCDPECQAKGPDAYSPPPDVRRDEDTTGDNPDEAEPETDVQHAERVVQDQLTAQFVTHQRFMRFIEAKEMSGPRNPDAEARVELTDEMIRETGAQFGVDLKDAQDLLAMRKTMSRNAFADWVNACGYLQIVQNALAKGTCEDRTSGLWKQALVRRTEKQKRRFTGFLNKIALKDSTFRHLSILTDDERKKMAMAFLQVGDRSDPWLAIRCASMYFYIDGMWTRAEDPRNRTLSDLHAFQYPPSGRTGASRSVMECICASKDSGKTTSPTGHWEVQTYTHHKEWLLCPIFWLALWMVVKYEAPGWKDIVPFPDVLAGREQGYGLQRVYCNAKTPHKSISPAAHGYATDQARKRANRTSFKNTYEGRSTKPNSLVAQFGTNPKWIEKAGWFADLGTFDRNYERVHHPDLVAQAAGHLSRDEYSGHLGIDPEDREEFREMSNLLWSWLQSQIDQLHQFNVNAPKEQRDLGGLMLLIVFNLLRRKFWQTGPLLEQLVPAHPVFTLDFLRPAKMNGSWDRWVAVTLNYHKEVAGMLRALDGPLFSMAGLQPPHLIVARLLEPVHEALRNNGQPGDVLLTSIWRLAGQVLLVVPDCPVQLAQAVYTLMGKDPPEHLLNSPVRQVSERQARTAEALEAISLTAQTVQQHQLAQASQQAGANLANAQPPSTASAATDSQSAQPEQESAFQLLHSVMATVASSNEAAMAPEHAPVLHMIGAVMAPVVQMLRDEQQKERAMHRASMDQLLQQNRQLSQQLDRVEQKIDSNAHFYPLMAVAMAQLSQQMHGLAQFLAAGVGSGRAKAGQLSPGPVPSVQQPVNTPQRKKMRKADDARHVARKQVLAVDERLDQQGPSAGPVQAPTVLGQRQTAAAVLTGPIANGVQTVYPGKAGEELWVTWRGRYATLGKYPSWQLLLDEWKEGIPYLSTTIGTRKQTVPMAQLEQDWAEGVQRKNSPSVPWRSLDRNSIRDRKIVPYGLLQAELQGQDLKEFMAPHVAAAKSLMEKSGTGAKPTLLTYIKRIFENDKNYMSPVDFEQKVLMWKHTPTILAQARSKQSTKAYPPEGIAEVA